MDNQTKITESTELEQLTDQLAELGRMFDRANRQIVDYLLSRESQGGKTDAGTSAPSPDIAELTKQVGELGGKLDRLAAAKPADSADASGLPPGISAEQLDALIKPLREKLDILDQQNTALYQTMEQLRSHVDGGVQSLAELLVPQKEEEPAGVSGDWLTAVLGSELVANGSLGVPCQKLLRGVLAGEPGAQALAGQLLVFHSASHERLPQLLKDVGEALYRWQPKTAPGNNLFEEALAAYLQRTCENAGMYNSIELVHPGQRFDSARHNATSRGVEIIRVLGWIVLRDNGKVYTKATVEVR